MINKPGVVQSRRIPVSPPEPGASTGSVPTMHVGRRLGLLSVKLHVDRSYSSATTRLVRRFDKALPAFWFATDNFGDAMSPDILARASGIRPIYCPRGSGRVLTTGSILHRASSGDVICGSGSLFPATKSFDESTTVLAVRGPRTAELIRGTKVPDVFGDPAQLLPELFDWPAVEQTLNGPIFVPHHSDLEAVRQRSNRFNIVSPLLPWRDVVDQIRAAELVLASSLHGLIVAEAFGRPAVWVSTQGQLAGGEHKFLDYLEGSGRNGGWRSVPIEVAEQRPELLPPPRYDMDKLRRAFAQLGESNPSDW